MKSEPSSGSGSRDEAGRDVEPMRATDVARRDADEVRADPAFELCREGVREGVWRDPGRESWCCRLDLLERTLLADEVGRERLTLRSSIIAAISPNVCSIRLMSVDERTELHIECARHGTTYGPRLDCRR